MEKLKDHLYLEGNSSAELLFGPEKEGTQHPFAALEKLIGDKAEPILKKYFDGLQLEEKLKKVTTVQELEKVEIVYIGLDFKKKLMQIVEKLPESYTMPQRVWCFDTFLSVYHNESVKFINEKMRLKAQELMQKKRIIT